MIVEKATYQFIRFQKYLNTSLSGKFVVSFIFLLIFSKSTFSQITTNTNVTAQQLVQTIVGPGYNVSNIKLNCPTGAIATFTSAGTNIGLGNGILLTTGKAALAAGPNNATNAGFNNGASGDSQLDVLLKTETYDGCAIEFDLIPSCDTLKIKYVFGSEEYPEYVNKQFNDVFSFFVTGPGIVGTKNIATVPGTATPVSINTVNAGKNSQYFVNNTNGNTVQYDGFTKPLMAFTPVVSCSTYHLKIVIADVTDGIFDSGVFIEGGSIECAPVIYNEMATNVNGVRNCKNGSFTFCRTGDEGNPYNVNYTIGGSAVNGVDYQTLPGTLTIPAGQKCATVDVIPLPSGSPKPMKTIEITYKYGFCPEPNTIVLTLTDPIPLDAGPDISICSGDSAQMGPKNNLTATYSWTPTAGLSNPSVSNPIISLVNNTNADIKYKYVLKATVSASNCVIYDTVVVTVRPHPIAKFYDNSPNHCFGSLTVFRDTSTATVGNKIVDWYWEFGNNLFDTVRHTSTTYTKAGSYNVKLLVTDDKGCSDDTTMVIEIWPLPNADFDLVSACFGDSVSFINKSTVPGGGTITLAIWSFGDGTPLLNAMNPKHLYSTTGPKNYTIQLFVTSDKNCVGGISKPLEIYPKPKADFNTSNICIYKDLRFNNYSDGNKSLWDFGDGTTSTVRNPSHMYSAWGLRNVKLVVSNNFGCKDSLTKSITVYPQPKYNFYATDTAGCPIFVTNFTAYADTVSGTDSITSWMWIFNPASIKYGKVVQGAPYAEAGKYSPTLIATSIHGCTDTLAKQYYIHVYPTPVPSFTLNPDELSIYQMKTQVIDGSSSDVVKWQWDLGDGIKELNKTKFYHDYSNGTASSYTVTLVATNQYNCTNSTTRTLHVVTERTVYIPNAFTPNGDGLNDKFMPYISGDFVNADFQMRIFDRWGLKLLFTGDVNQGWNGIYKGDLCERDVYVYSVIFTSKEDGSVLAKFKGTVTLVQ
jgi:gliding motility-associated-like protein